MCVRSLVGELKSHIPQGDYTQRNHALREIMKIPREPQLRPDTAKDRLFFFLKGSSRIF